MQIDQRVHKPCHGYDVLRVVFDDIFQQRRLARLDIGEVARGHLAARQVVLARGIEYLAFKLGQLAGTHTHLEYTPGDVDQIDIIRRFIAPVHPVHGQPALNQRHIKAGAVKGDHRLAAAECFKHRRQHERFLIIVAHQILCHHKLIA